MQKLEQLQKQAASLYRLAWLLTGNQETSIDATLEVLDTESDAGAFFERWMLSWSRRIVIAKVLNVIRRELAVSAQRTASIRVKALGLPPLSATLGDMTDIQLERALLAIDMFPRCALILTVFEGMSVEDTAVVLDCTPELARKARTLGLRHLIENLATMQAPQSVAYEPLAIAAEVQHA
jgi:DNA-directed RNA polymerase specialized sigma24 family protein